MSQQPQTTTLSELKKPVPPLDPSIKAGFDTVGGFDLIQRTAKLFAASNIVPQQFQGNLPNCVIAVDMALRTARACSGVCPCAGACPEGCHSWLANGDACRAVRAVWLDVVRCGLGKQGDTPTRRPKEQKRACQGYSNQAIPRGGIEGMARGR